MKLLHPSPNLDRDLGRHDRHHHHDLGSHMKIELNIPNILRAARQDPELMSRLGRCRYSSPCVIALGMAPEQRAWLKKTKRDSKRITQLVDEGVVSFPDEQQAIDARALQFAFDWQNEVRFDEVLAELEGRYLKVLS